MVSKKTPNRSRRAGQGRRGISVAAAIRELERWYGIFNEQLFGGKLSRRVVITIQSTGRRRRVLGWHAQARWVPKGKGAFPELNIVAEALHRPVEEILETLLHEMCHQYNAQRNVVDVSSEQQYHNRKFKEAAEFVGLECEQSLYYGWAFTRLGPRARAILERFRPDGKVFRVARVPEAIGARRKGTKLAKWVCRCGYGVRVAIPEFRARCEACGARFRRAG